MKHVKVSGDGERRKVLPDYTVMKIFLIVLYIWKYIFFIL